MRSLHSTMIAAPQRDCVDRVAGNQAGVTAAERGALLRVLAVAMVCSALAGCYTDRATVASAPLEYRQRHPIAIQEKDHTVELFIGTKRGGLLPAERATVAAFATAWKREASGGIVVEVPSGTPNERAAHDAMREAHGILVAGGIPEHGIIVRPYHPRDPRKFATLRLNYPMVAADAGPCGLWPQDIGSSNFREHVENRQYWNFGCATQRNVAAMVENPADLAQPRGETPVYRARRTVVLDKYRKGEGTVSTNPDAGKGKISDIGQ